MNVEMWHQNSSKGALMSCPTSQRNVIMELQPGRVAAVPRPSCGGSRGLHRRFKRPVKIRIKVGNVCGFLQKAIIWTIMFSGAVRGANSVFERCPLIQPEQLKQLRFVFDHLLILIHRED